MDLFDFTSILHKIPALTTLDISTPLPELQEYLRVREWLNSEENITTIEKPGEGNMNVVLRVVTDQRSFILKQSRPYVQKISTDHSPRGTYRR